MVDLDNTLVDRAGAVRTWAVELAAQHRLPATAVDRLIELDGDGYADRGLVFQELRDRYGLAEPMDDLASAYRSRLVELIQPTQGAIGCLTELRRAGWALAIVSNGAGEWQRAKIEKLGLGALVDAVCISGEVGVAKPDAAIFHLAAERTGTALDRSWMVGDSPVHDIVGAARLGLGTVWLRRGRTWEEVLARSPGPSGAWAPAGAAPVRPTRTIDSLADLATAIG